MTAEPTPRNRTLRRALNRLGYAAQLLGARIEIEFVEDKWVALLLPKDGVALSGKGKAPSEAVLMLDRELEALAAKGSEA